MLQHRWQIRQYNCNDATVHSNKTDYTLNRKPAEAHEWCCIPAAADTAADAGDAATPGAAATRAGCRSSWGAASGRKAEARHNRCASGACGACCT